jgi:copper resistance protein B
MKDTNIASSIAAALLLTSTVAHAGMDDDPTLFSVMIDKLEYRAMKGDNLVVWDADAWLGKDLNKLWFKTEGEIANGTTEDAWAEILYSRGISAYWDVQLGWRHDFRPQPSRDWLAVGFKGLAPYWFDVDATAYARNDGSLFARLNLEYELMLSQQLILSPELELNAYSKADQARGIGAGLSTAELGLRLRYEIRREFAPYIGVNWEKSFGDTAGFASDAGESTSELQFVVGVRAWF